MAKIRESKLREVYEIPGKRRIFTINLNKGKKVYDEVLYSNLGKEYREWNPRKSKLGAGIMKGMSQTGIIPGKKILYLGCSTGTTCSHVSDIIGNNGFLFGLDVAPRVMREFVFLCESRKNMAPLFYDAAHPENYSDIIKKAGWMDVVFQDIAQRQQLEIFLKNCDMFLKNGGFGILAVKARSIDVTAKPKEIFHNIRQKLNTKMPVVDYRNLEPYEADHCLFVVKKK